MNYSALIQNRKSVRVFAGKKVPAAALAEIEAYYHKSCQRLIPERELSDWRTELSGSPVRQG